MAHLRSYAVGESAEISLKSALAEARDTLREVRKRREFSDSDIAVRTELSYARQMMNVVREVLFGGRGKVESMRERMETTDREPIQQNFFYPHFSLKNGFRF